MKHTRAALLISSIMAASALPSSSLATTPTPPRVEESIETVTVSPKDLEGIWDVALFFSPTSAPSATVMEIKSVKSDGTLEGTFYGTEFETARYTQRNGEVAFAIITSDGSGPYATSGRILPGGKVKGQTLAPGRDFIMMWEADRR